MPKKPKSSTRNSSCKKLYVQGMHCSACEILVKQEIEALDGVDNVEVSLDKSTIKINTKPNFTPPEPNQLNEMFFESGYRFDYNKSADRKLTNQDVIKTIFLVLAFLAAFYLVEKTQLLMYINLSSSSGPLTYFLFGIAAGVSSCAALVGGILLSFSKKWNEIYNGNSKKAVTPFIYFNLSRLIAFGMFGGLLGFFGSLFTFSISTMAFLSVGISVLMIVVGLQMIGVRVFYNYSIGLIPSSGAGVTKNFGMHSRLFPFVIGGGTFFVPCGFTLVAQSNALLAGNYMTGFLNLFSFALGTLPVLALISFTSIKFYSSPRFSKRFNLFAGILILFFAVYTLNSQLNVLGKKSLNDLFSRFDTSSSKPEEVYMEYADVDYQVMQIEAINFDYYPKQINIKSNMKTRLNIIDGGAVGCSRAVYARGLYPEVIYLNSPVTSVEFVSPQPGTYKVTCSMGMVTPITVNVL